MSDDPSGRTPLVSTSSQQFIIALTVAVRPANNTPHWVNAADTAGGVAFKLYDTAAHALARTNAINNTGSADTGTAVAAAYTGIIGFRLQRHRHAAVRGVEHLHGRVRDLEGRAQMQAAAVTDQPASAPGS